MPQVDIDPSMFDVESLSGHSRGHAKEFAEPAAELSEVAAGGAGKRVGCGKLGVATGQILGHRVVSLESIVTCSGSPPQTGPMLMPALPLSSYAVAPDFLRCQSKPLWLRNIANVLLLKDSDLRNDEKCVGSER